MSTTYKVECDCCGNDLTSTSNCEGYRLDLTVTSLPTHGGLVTMMHIYPPLKQNAQFCDIRCLRQWLAKEHPESPPSGSVEIDKIMPESNARTFVTLPQENVSFKEANDRASTNKT